MYDMMRMKDHDYKWIGALYQKGSKMIKLVTNHNYAHYFFSNHSRLELLKILKSRFLSCCLTFKCLFVREALASMVSSDSWECLKDRATSVFDRHEFHCRPCRPLKSHCIQQKCPSPMRAPV